MEDFAAFASSPRIGERGGGERVSGGAAEADGPLPAADGLHNLYADVPAAPAGENAPLVILQGHMDMVCAVRPGSGYDPVGSPVRIEAADGFLRSDGRSSLGADNNLGNAAVLWLLGRGVGTDRCASSLPYRRRWAFGGRRPWTRPGCGARDYLINTDGFHLGRAVVSFRRGQAGDLLPSPGDGGPRPARPIRVNCRSSPAATPGTTSTGAGQSHQAADGLPHGAGLRL